MKTTHHHPAAAAPTYRGTDIIRSLALRYQRNPHLSPRLRLESGRWYSMPLSITLTPATAPICLGTLQSTALPDVKARIAKLPANPAKP